MRPRKRSAYYRDKVNKRWKNNKNPQEESNGDTGESVENAEDTFNESAEDLHVVGNIDGSENCEENVPSKSARIKKKFEVLKENVSADNDSSQYLFVDISQLNILLHNVKCTDCGGTSLNFEISDENSGFARKIILQCKECELNGLELKKSETYTSKRVVNKDTTR